MPASTSSKEGTPEPAGEVTRLLVAWRNGDPDAPRELFARLYQELRRLAGAQLRARAGQTLSATALVHEVYLKLVRPGAAVARDRHHFFAVAARAMRHVVVDRARRGAARKRGGGTDRTTLDENSLRLDTPADEVLALDGALSALEALDPRLGRLVELRYFAGLSLEEAANALGVSARTAKRDWRKARSFLYREIRGAAGP